MAYSPAVTPAKSETISFVVKDFAFTTLETFFNFDFLQFLVFCDEIMNIQLGS